jgi:Ca2+-binding RTX toxin-like protein
MNPKAITRDLPKAIQLGVCVLAAALVGNLFLAAIAQAAGSVSVSATGSYLQVKYTGSSDVNVATFGGSVAERSVTITESGIADPPDAADPEHFCDLTGPNILTCKNPTQLSQYDPRGVADMGAGNDVTSGTGTAEWRVYGGTGDDSLTGSDQALDYLNGEAGHDTLDGLGGPGGTNGWEYLVGGEDDDVLLGGASPDQLSGDAGNDDLAGGGGDDYLFGSIGVDSLRAGPGNDVVNAGPGDGELSEGGDGSDELDCEGDADEVYEGGSGFDTIECSGGVFSGDAFDRHDFLIDLAAGVVRRTNHVQTVATLRSAEDVYTFGGNDVLLGTDGANVLYAGGGNDALDGRGGSDVLRGELGNDTLETGDGTPDRADAGPDDDTCSADPFDELFGCETLFVTTASGAGGGTGADLEAPVIGAVTLAPRRFAVARRPTAIAAARRGTTIGYALSEPAAVTLRFQRVRRGRYVGVGALRRAGRTGSNRLRFSGRIGRRALRPGAYRLVVSAVDAAGNRSTRRSRSFRIVR